MKRIATLKLSKETIEALKSEPKNTLYQDVLNMKGKRITISIVKPSHEFSIEMANFITISGEETSLPIECFENIEKTPNMGHSGLQKEYFGQRGQVYTNSYGRMPSKIKEFEEIVKKDFPNIKDDDMEIVIFGGERKSRIMGLRFNIPEEADIPKDYFEWNTSWQMDVIN